MDAATLAREKQISLTTFKQDGTPVSSTPVWTVSDDGRRLLVLERGGHMEGEADSP